MNDLKTSTLITDITINRCIPDYNEPVVRFTLPNEAFFQKWFKEVASLHAQWRSKPSKVYKHKKQANLMGKNLVEALPFETSDYPCSRFRKAKENNGDKGQPSKKIRATYKESFRKGCTAKISKVLMADSTITVLYHWDHHLAYDPYSMQDIKDSHLPLELKQWLKEKVGLCMDWKAIHKVTRLSEDHLNEVLKVVISMY
jgi:hypothetical protein